MRSRVLVTVACSSVVEIVPDAHCGGLLWDIRGGRGRSCPIHTFTTTNSILTGLG